ncbi:MAG TPA: lytic transglycosylase domain-containing protein [Thiolapillus brandeum]|uniref:Lytic transglycosylase domain-containing protein n=1 Tax=Thiolapillus brandeum TaxID=1076588 RepID=A0A7C5MZ07_9GAMM|nr:lytic transglycosylase domain-containing protein [Thiolapillus brandeum]
MRTWSLLLFLPAVALAAGFKGVDHEHWTDKYDRHFRKYAKHYFGPAFDWRWFKAQGIAESGLRPDARSKSGAVGIMQIMPATFKYIQKKNPAIRDLHEPRWNIAAAIFYDRHLYDKWKDEPLEAEERLFFALGAYNAGHLRVRRAYNKVVKKLGRVAQWEEVDDFVPGQTRHYVRRIRRLMAEAL